VVFTRDRIVPQIDMAEERERPMGDPAVMRAIAVSGYQGYVAHEYNPVRDPMESLVQAVKACDV